MMKTLVLHIGFHKTGTSALQEWLSENPAYLRRHNVFYPKPLLGFPSHLELVSAIRPKLIHWRNDMIEPEYVYNHFLNEIKNAPKNATIILSSEELCSLSYFSEDLRYIYDKFANLPDVRLKIIAYTRSALNFAVSLYHHLVIETNYEHDFAHYLRHDFMVESCSFEARLTLWVNQFGHDCMNVLSYEDELKKYGKFGIVESFLTALDIPSQAQNADTYRANRGLHPWLMTAYRHINTLEKTAQEKSELRRKLVEFGSELPAIDGAAFYLDADAYQKLCTELQ